MKNFCKKELFKIPNEITFLNCAYQGPKLKSSEVEGIKGIELQMNPSNVQPKDFFENPNKVRKSFSKLFRHFFAQGTNTP